MRHRIKKIPTIKHLLHSNKSTYFYNSKLRYYIAPICVSNALLLVLGLMINPIVNADAAHAAEKDPQIGPLNYEPRISMTILNNGNIIEDDATVSANADAGVVSYISNTIKINTHRINKFYVGVQAASDGKSELTGLNHSQTIAGVGTNVAPANFGDNTWGYALTDNTTTTDNNLTYSTLPAYNSVSPIQYTSTANPSNGDHNLKLTFAAKINANKPGDHYQTKAMVSLAADPQTVTISNLSYMQEMFPGACSASAEGESKQLIDKRDNTYTTHYTVKKLSDGKCWMTDNLRITDKAISSADSDLPEGGTYTIPASSNPWSDTGAETNKVHYAGNTTHGAYYTWYTATAGTGKSSVQSGQASGSICPKGWRLPTGGSSGEFQALYNKGKSSWTTNNSINGYWLGGTSSSAAGAAFFTASGNVYSGSLSGVGSFGRYWSSTPTSGNAYYLGFYSSGVAPALDYSRYYGFSVRCVVR